MSALTDKPFTRFRRYRASPAQLLVGGASSVILLGTLFLSLPQAAANGHSIGFVNALFSATSAVCVTGLIVLDTPHDFTTFGHAVLLFLFQVGGLGYMTAATFIALILGRRVGLRDRLVLKEAMASPTMDGLMRLAVLTVKITFIVEAITAIALMIRFLKDMSPGQALWYGVFHAVSAFNNAGFALFSDSLAGYRSDPLFLVPIALSIVLGGMGFLVFNEVILLLKGRIRRLSVHTRLTLLMTVVVGAFGSMAFSLLELSHEGVMHAHGPARIFEASLFQSIAARTAGFSTVDMMVLEPATIFLLIILMMIGGGSGSTAGGIKVSSFGIICASMLATLRGREQVTLFHRTIPQSTVQKSFFLGAAALFMVAGVTWVVLAMEGTGFLPTMFEVASAAGTVGLSFGDGQGRSLVAGFSDPGKLLIAFCMFIGRLGPLTIGIAVLTSESSQRYRLPEEKVLIG